MNKDDRQRRHIRVRDDIPVRWYIDKLGLSGRGILRNLSVSGAMLETRVLVAVDAGLFVTLKAEDPSESSFVPPLGRFVWGKGARQGVGYFFYGLEFKDQPAEYSQAIEERVEGKMKSTSFGLGSGITDTSLDIR